MESSKQLKIGAAVSYIAIAFNIISGLLYTPWMVATIGTSQYGLYTLAYSVITLFLVDFGLSSATARYLSKYHAVGDQEGAERFLGAVYKLYILIDTVILCALTIVYFLIDKIYVNLTVVELEQFKVVYIISALFSVVNFPFITLNGILTAYEKFVPLKVADLLYRLFTIGFTVIALIMGYGLYALVTANVVSGLLALLFKYVVIRKTVRINANFKYKVKGIYKEILGFSLWVMVSSLAQRLIFNITPSVLGIVANSAAIAVFGVVTVIEGYTYTITTAINGMFMPKIAKIMVGDHVKEKLNELFIGVGRFQMIINGLLIVGFAIVGKTFINIWMGAEYSEAYVGILFVLIPGLFYNPLQIGNTALVVEKKVKLAAKINLIMGIVNITLSFPLAMCLGVTGACISICMAYFVRDILLHIVLHRELALDVVGFMKSCYLRMLIPVLLTLLCGKLLNMIITDSGWIVFAYKCAIIAGVYLILTYFFALKKEERMGIINSVKKKIGK